MRLRHDHKVALAIGQVVVIGIIFFITNGVVALGLYLVSEISLVELITFLATVGGSDGVAITLYGVFHRAKNKLWTLLNEQRDSEVVSEAKLNELKKLLRK
ncbi:MAG: hypothetical protein ACREA3_09765 [Nitrosotalea sp.]